MLTLERTAPFRPPMAAPGRWLLLAGVATSLLLTAGGASRISALPGGPATGTAPSPATTADTSEVERLLRGRLEAMRAGHDVGVEGRRLLARRALPSFYEGRAFAPAWAVGSDGPARVASLLTALDRATTHGLDREDYHRTAIDSLARRLSTGSTSPEQRVAVELLATDAFLVLGSHLLLGRVNPETIDPEWLANRRSARLEDVLEEALRSGRIEARLFELAPRQPRYATLLRAAASLRSIAVDGGWPVVPDGPRLEEGVRDERVRLLRRRLRASGDLDPTSRRVSDLFDGAVLEGVRRFQERHGLEVDGIVGPATLGALNVSAEERARQIETNLERWRWLPDDLGERHIEVNIAGFDVRVVERGVVVRRHRAVVGRQYRQTPMFSGSMTYLVLSPYWHVPPTIAAVDKLPVIKADPAQISAQRMTLLEPSTGRAVDPSTVDWAAMTGSEFNRRYRLRQNPGPWNALGAVKFMFPNRYNVYLHDTPSRELFERARRSFSSGCIRVQNALGLAEYLLADQPEWTRARMDQVVAGGVERTVSLTRQMPVHLLYWTAWAEDGVVHFREDLYGRDLAVQRAVEAPPPGA